MQHLKHFEFMASGAHPRRAALTPPEIEKLGDFLSAMCSSRQLETIRLCFEGLWETNMPDVPSLSPCIPNFKSQKLKKLRLFALPFHLSEIEPLLDQMLILSRPELLSMELNYPMLVSGLWRDALEVLRDKIVPANVILEIIAPWGVEDWGSAAPWPNSRKRVRNYSTNLPLVAFLLPSFT